MKNNMEQTPEAFAVTIEKKGEGRRLCYFLLIKTINIEEMKQITEREKREK